MTKDEALRLALEALEGVLDDSPKVLDASISGGLYEVVQCRDAITAIKAALEAKDEPVATLEDLEQEIYENTRQFVSTDVMEWMLKRYYTTPPQRKPLTDEEIEDVWASCEPDWDDKVNVLTLARAIEAAHGIKGEA